MPKKDTSSGKQSNSDSRDVNFDYKGNGVQTPTYQKPAPMPPIKPAKPDDDK